MNSTELFLHTMKALDGPGVEVKEYDRPAAGRVSFLRLPLDHKKDYVLEFVGKHKDGPFLLAEAISQMEEDQDIHDILNYMARVIDKKQPSSEWFV